MSNPTQTDSLVKKEGTQISGKHNFKTQDERGLFTVALLSHVIQFASSRKAELHLSAGLLAKAVSLN